ncbi:MAG: RNA polymerase sigma factor RpoD/SigA [Candidatus Omnitrophica bacterium]|nr:RNA polymerase sigma factor RpoD/SigA [Candidatus Omnitrophota bacterium]MCM8792947.1 RNA polymerase sigma factor RpoD/SigA [Candidatus Omnitrophota bacterium]
MEPIRAYLRDIKKVEKLTAEEEIKLARRAKRGDRIARDRLIHANLPLVINMAKKYSFLGLPLTDLIEEGNIGLMHAVTKFNPNKGYRFSTYAAWWVRQYITRAIANQARVVRLPVYINEMISKLHKVTERLSHKLGRKPTDKEIAKEMDISVRKVKEISQLSSRTSSLDRMVIEQSSTEFVDLVEDVTAKNAVDELVSLFRHEKVAELLSMMPEREREILSMRFGFQEGVPHTLSEVADKFSLSRERIRQIEANALKKMRKLLTSQQAKKFYFLKKRLREEEKKELPHQIKKSRKRKKR